MSDFEVIENPLLLAPGDYVQESDDAFVCLGDGNGLVFIVGAQPWNTTTTSFGVVIFCVITKRGYERRGYAAGMKMHRLVMR